MRMGSAQGNDANVDAETSAEQTINICDFKGGEIDFPHPPSENQGLILEYSVDSRASCDAFIGNSHNMHYQLEIVSFDENVQKICVGLTKSQRPTLQILQMREVIDVSKDKKTGHRLRNTDLCQLFGLLEKYEKSLPHLFIFNHKKEIHNVLGMRINGRLGGPSFKLRLTRIPTPPKNPIFVTAGSPTRLQCLSACPSDTATLFYVDESGRIRNITDRAMTETIATGQNRPFLENIVIEGEAKGFRRSCSSKLFIAKVFKIQLEDPIAESGTYTFSFGNEEDCTFILNTDINECDSDPCRNGGTCTNTQGSYFCRCQEGWAGNHCNQDINECDRYPCANGGTCTNTQGSYWCRCQEGWTGNYCNQGTDTDTCKDLNKHCAHWKEGGSCKDSEIFMNKYCAKSCGTCPAFYDEDNYVDLYGLGKAFATSTWSSSNERTYEAKNAFWFTKDNNERYWCSKARSSPAAIWFQFEQPKRIIKIKFEEHYKLPVGHVYEVFASNKYDNCGDIATRSILVRSEASVFAGGKDFQNEKNYYCYGVRAYAYDDVHKTVALKRIQLRIEGHITCQMGHQGFSNEETATQNAVVKGISLKGFKEKPKMVVALKDITVTGSISGLKAHGTVHSATYASLQLFIVTADKPRGVAITWIACGK